MRDVALYHPTSPMDWWRIYRLYRQAFPRDERKPFSIIRKMCKEGRTIVWLARTTDGRFAGMASTIESPDITLLDYFAIAPKLRIQGYGSVFLQRLLLCPTAKQYTAQKNLRQWMTKANTILQTT